MAVVGTTKCEITSYGIILNDIDIKVFCDAISQKNGELCFVKALQTIHSNAKFNSDKAYKVNDAIKKSLKRFITLTIN